MLVVLMINQTYCFDLITKARKVFKVSDRDKVLESPYVDLMDALNILRENQTHTAEFANAMHSNEAVKSMKVDELDYLAAFSAIFSICQKNVKLLHYAHGRRDYEYIQYPRWTYKDTNYNGMGLKEKYKDQELVSLRKVEKKFAFLLELFNRKNNGGNLTAGIDHIKRAKEMHTIAYSTFLKLFADFPKTEFKKFKSTLNQTNKFYQELIKSSADAINVQNTQDYKDIQKKLTHLGIYIEAREDGTFKA